MKNWKTITIAIVALTAVSLTAASVYALCWGGLGTPATYSPYTGTTNQYVGNPNGVTTVTPSTPTAPTTTTSTGQTSPTPTSLSTQNLAPVTQTNTQTPTLYTPPSTQIITPGYSSYGGCGGGCMGGRGYGASTYPNPATTAAPLTINQAIQIATIYVTSLNNPDLKVTQVEEYTANFYVLVNERSTGYGAFQLLINKNTGMVTPEPGPNMMWNTKYTFTTGYCNWYRAAPTTTPTVTVDQAKANAQQYLNAYYPGATVGDVTTFYGYYTIEVLNAGNTYGMLSVNAYTGQVWYHTWHGAFIQEAVVA
jgi:hypothetical protein